MKLNAPKKLTWWVAVIIAAVDVAVKVLSMLNVFTIPFVEAHRFLIMLIAFIILLLGTFIKGL
jgi:hypothetical protein